MRTEVIRVDDIKVTLIESDAGTWTAQSGYGYAKADSRSDAIKAVKKVIADAQAEDERQSEAVATKISERNAKTVECSVCGTRVTNLKAHEKSAHHKNQKAWQEHKLFRRF